MPTEPLQPFAPPLGITFDLPANLSPHTIIAWFLVFAVLYWIVYTIIAIYHWFTYSHKAKIAYPAIVVHLVVSFVLVNLAISGLL